ncbi:MAG: 30S ribosomal protein S1 [Gemmataceae bacterium]
MTEPEKQDDAPQTNPEPAQWASSHPEEAEGPAGKPEPAPARVPSLEHEQSTGGPSIRELDAQIEREMQEAMGGLSEKEMYGDLGPRARQGAAPGQAAQKAKVLSVHGPDVFVDVPGGRSQGVLPITQFPEGAPAPGTEVDIKIERYDEANGLLVLSRRGAAVDADWSTVQTGMVVEGRVTGTNKGGLSLDVNGIRGFMPVSQIDLYRVENPEQFVNQRLTCMVTEANQVERNLVLSRRALLEKEREEQRDKLWEQLAEGQVHEGIVRSVRDFGAFVDLGGVDGLLHVSEMSWSRVQDPNSVVQPGQRVKVAVLRIDRDKRKVSLGLKQLQASPWDEVEARFPPSTKVTGKVTRIMDFGAFVELEPGVEGLIHISELSPQRVRRVADVVQVGQSVDVTVLKIDKAQRRISLSLKASQAGAEAAAEAEAEPEAPVEKKPPRPRATPLRGGIGDRKLEFE